MNSVLFLTSQSKRNTFDFFPAREPDGATGNECSFIQLTETAQREGRDKSKPTNSLEYKKPTTGGENLTGGEFIQKTASSGRADFTISSTTQGERVGKGQIVKGKRSPKWKPACDASAADKLAIFRVAEDQNARATREKRATIS